MGEKDRKNRVPLSLNTWDRNERLLPTLLGMGLAVEPVYTEHGDIDYFMVSCGTQCFLKDQGQDQG